MNKSRAAVLVTALWVAGCGPSPLTGKVEVVGGSAAGVVVQVAGPVASSVVCDEAGAFKLVELKDGDYALKAEVAGTEEKTQTLAVTVKDGKASKELTLTFHAPSGTVKGKVVFADGSDAAGLVVNLTGADTRAATTGAGGVFGFEGVPAGGWVVSVEAPWTLEGRVALGVALGVGQAADVGTLDLSPVGELGGVVSQGATPEALVQLVVAGTTLVAVSDAAGAFRFPRVPAGDRTVLASKGAGLGALAGTAAVKVVRGKNASLAVGMTKVLPKTGTVAGTITFTSAQAPTLITLTVAGAQVTGAPALDGNYALTVPVGTWEVFATAPNYPKQSLGVVVVNEGLTTTLKPGFLSWWKAVSEEATGFTIPKADVCQAGPWAALALADGTNARLMVFNTKTLERRNVAAGTVTEVRFSSKCKYLFYILDGVAMVHEVGTANVRSLGFGAVAPFAFSTDESTLFLARYGHPLTPAPLGTQEGLERVNLAAATSTGFPSAALGVFPQNEDRYFVREVGDSIRLVTPASDTVVFTAAHATQWGAKPTGWALTNCAGTCTLKVLPPNGTLASAVTAGTYSSASVVSGSSPDWVAFALLPAARRLVRSSDAMSVALPVSTNRLSISPDGSRLAYFGRPVADQELREEPLPASGTSAVLASTVAAFDDNWLSNTRLVAYDRPNNRVVDVKAGVAAFDNAVAAPTTANLFCARGALAVWPQSGSAQKWKVLLADAPALTADGPNVSNPGEAVSCAARASVVGDPAVAWAGFSIDSSSTYVVDGAAAQVRRQFVGRAGGPGFLSEGVELLPTTPVPTGLNLYLPASGQLIAIADGDKQFVSASPSAVSGFVVFGRDAHTLYVARLWQ